MARKKAPKKMAGTSMAKAAQTVGQKRVKRMAHGPKPRRFVAAGVPAKGRG